ncbi:helix-turn-helix domain-containing protein [Brevibacterium sp. JNUCC-42]|nr:helix-turn-helix domain-containing protein [Brevibacterium sp. JNUCC-42]
MHFYPVAITSEYQETLATFFQHNMQVSETARSLFLHRNTYITYDRGIRRY